MFQSNHLRCLATPASKVNRSHKLTLGKLKKRVYKWPDPTRVTKKKPALKKAWVGFQGEDMLGDPPIESCGFFWGEHPYASLGLVTGAPPDPRSKSRRWRNRSRSKSCHHPGNYNFLDPRRIGLNMWRKKTHETLKSWSKRHLRCKKSVTAK